MALLTDLSTELLIEILQRLPYLDIVKCRRVSGLLCRVASSNACLALLRGD